MVLGRLATSDSVLGELAELALSRRHQDCMAAVEAPAPVPSCSAKEWEDARLRAFEPPRCVEEKDPDDLDHPDHVFSISDMDPAYEYLYAKDDW